MFFPFSIPEGATVVTSTGVVQYGAEEVDLQAAIDAVWNTGGGSVWVLTSFTLTAPIILRSHVSLDFLGHSLQLATDTICLSATGCRRVGVRNVSIRPFQSTSAPTDSSCQESQTSPIILLEPISDDVEDCIFSDIWIRSTEFAGTTPWHCYNSIELRTSQRAITNNTFENMRLTGCCNSVYLRVEQDGIIRGNLISALAPWRTRSQIAFSATSLVDPAQIYHNTFRIIKGQADATITQINTQDIFGNGNHFDHVLLWDVWLADKPCCPGTPVAMWTIGAASYTYISADVLAPMANTDPTARIFDNGDEAKIVCGLASDLITECSDSLQSLCEVVSCLSTEGSNLYREFHEVSGRRTSFRQRRIRGSYACASEHCRD